MPTKNHHPVLRRVRTNNGPSTAFLARILEALDCDLSWLAQEAHVKYDEVLAMHHGTRMQLVAVDQDPAWMAIAAYVDKRIGLLLAVRTELQRKLDLDRLERAAQRKRILER